MPENATPTREHDRTENTGRCVLSLFCCPKCVICCRSFNLSCIFDLLVAIRTTRIFLLCSVLANRYSYTSQKPELASVPVKQWPIDKPFVDMLVDLGNVLRCYSSFRLLLQTKSHVAFSTDIDWLLWIFIAFVSDVVSLCCVCADTPVILRGTIVDAWKARDLWTPDYLAKHIGLKSVCFVLLLCLISFDFVCWLVCFMVFASYVVAVCRKILLFDCHDLKVF